MLLLLLPIGLGFLVGAVFGGARPAARVIAAGTAFFVLLVVWAQGAALGADAEVRALLAPLAAQAGLLTASIGAFTLLLVELAARGLGLARQREEARTGEGSWKTALRTAFVLLVVLGAGLGAGVLLEAHADRLAPWRDAPLFGLLAFIGADLGRRRAAVVRELRRAGRLLLLAPVALVAAVLGALAVLPWLPHSSAAMIAGSVGFGFYSVSGPMVTALDQPAAGGVVFLANLFRELSAMVLVPLLARAGLSAPTAAAWGGATAMDSTLPFLVRSYGSAGAAAGLALGMLLSVAVPVLVPLVYALLSAG
ncbi:MAG: DUF340 domain-containing protein [Deltaproteobacteria bacterium]|nr:MAG: DUF340 domain-containing protein [Deltaproteobacteria bacterium]